MQGREISYTKNGKRDGKSERTKDVKVQPDDGPFILNIDLPLRSS